MMRHVSADDLARFHDGQLRPRKARRVGAHLQECARCRDVSAALARIPALLAAADVPEIPAHLAARIEMALATESAHRAAGAPSMRPARPHRASRPGRAGQAARAALGWRPSAAMAGLAAAVIVIAGGGYEAATHLTGSSGASSAASSAGKPEIRNGTGTSARGGVAAPEIQRTPVVGPAVPYQRDGRTGTFRPVRTTTDYQPGQLARQVATALAEVSIGAATNGRPASGASRPASAPHKAVTGLGPARQARLSGCVSRIAAGRSVLLVDLARYRAVPATVIVTAAQGSAPAQIWVVGTDCSRSAGDVLARRRLPAG